MPASSSSSTFTTMSSAKRKLVMSHPPMLTLPSWSSKASQMILSRKMLKRVGESRHPCRTHTVVLNHSSVLPLNRTALWAFNTDFQWLVWCWHWCCISSLLPIRLRAIPCQRPSWSLWRHGRDSADAAGISRRGSWDWIFVLWCSFRLWNLSMISSACGWSLFRMIFSMTLLGWLIRLMVL